MTLTEGSAKTGMLRLFVSYAREDRQGIQVLLEGVERLRHEVWVDKELSGGQSWWNEILAHIRSSDALLIAVSPRLLSSEASALERRYAQELGKPLLPVVIRPIRAHLLPPDLAPLQFVDYTDPGPMAAFELAGALASLPAPAALPDPLPDPPAVPISYLSDLTARVYAATLTLDEQLALVARLRTALLLKTEEREAALELLQALRSRRDLYHAGARDIENSIPQEVSDRMSNSAPEAETGGSSSMKTHHLTLLHPRSHLVGTPTPPVGTSCAGSTWIGRHGCRTGARSARIPCKFCWSRSKQGGHHGHPGDGSAPRAEDRSRCGRVGATSGTLPAAPPPPSVHGYPGYPRQAVGSTQQKPSAYWPLSIISFLMFFLIGGVALYFSAQVDSRWKAGNVDGANKASKTALIVSLIGLTVGAIVTMSVLAGGGGGATF